MITNDTETILKQFLIFLFLRLRSLFPFCFFITLWLLKHKLLLCPYGILFLPEER